MRTGRAEARESRIAVLEIESIAAGGDGVARENGLVTFVPRTAPGDRVRATVTVAGRLARGQVVEVLSPAACRATPTCPHYATDACGGCQLQHLSLDAQRNAKRVIVRDALTRIGKRPIALPPIRGGAATRYRSRIALALRREGSAMPWTGGFHRFDNPDSVFELRDCAVADERLVQVWQAIRPHARLFPRTRALRLTIRLAGDGVALVVEGADRWNEDDPRELLAQVPTIRSVWWVRPDGSKALAAGVRDAAPAFVQVNAEVGAMLRAHVESAVRAVAPGHVVDAYAGVGELTTALGASGVRCTAIELDAEAVEELRQRVAAPSVVIAGRVEDSIAVALPADVIVLNPPRAGVGPGVCDAVNASNARVVIYVSCDPATLARDLARMPRWAIADVMLFDMFPQTAHVETVVCLERAA
ncbi:MAG: class I SAM-dependent RNA methyltransferase [Gemmatimonadetes bacterium]|nr:class I SAM-dependent RNA methyltransferase [Gemmatimonadota bacterium]